ncbi:MAG: SAM-dependent chlorinase/fluorinase [Syntrophales bacterium]|nr:SAM-dependent chlorinase/fluorinase [Syntrophales bacterium]
MIITLTTDFGLIDPYVAQMKGVILSINPQVTLVDITHEIPPQQVKVASFVLGISFPYFPAGTIHVVVVDPGVGSERRGIIVCAGQHTFVGPDNGIFSSVLEKVKKTGYRIYHISNPPHISWLPSRTFHGRDVFAPVAAKLAMGAEPGEFGDEIGEITLLPFNEPKKRGNVIEAEVVYIDRFGNAVTNVSENDLPAGFKIDHLMYKGEIAKPAHFYLDSKEHLACLFNSMGLLELFSPLGSAKDKFGIKTGTQVEVILTPT